MAWMQNHEIHHFQTAGTQDSVINEIKLLII